MKASGATASINRSGVFSRKSPAKRARKYFCNGPRVITEYPTESRVAGGIPVRTYTPGADPQIARLRTGRFFWISRTASAILSFESVTAQVRGPMEGAGTRFNQAMPPLECVFGGTTFAILIFQSACEWDNSLIALIIRTYRTTYAP